VISDRQRWNRKYRQMDTAGESVAPIVAAHYPLAPPGRALDIAAGAGQNARFLAEKGFTVTAVDISDVALAPLAGIHPRLHPVCLDLDQWTPPKNRFQLVIDLRYLNRRLFTPIHESLAKGGVLIFETFIDPPPGRDVASHCKDYLLKENELRHTFSSMDIVLYEEAVRECPQGIGKMASLVAVKR